MKERALHISRERRLQARRTARVKALKSEGTWNVPGTGRRSVWLEHSEKEAMRRRGSGGQHGKGRLTLAESLTHIERESPWYVSRR